MLIRVHQFPRYFQPAFKFFPLISDVIMTLDTRGAKARVDFGSGPFFGSHLVLRVVPIEC